MRMIPETTRKRIIEALKVTPNAAAVAREIGNVSISTVGAIAKKANIDLGRSGPKKFSAEKCAQIIEALKANPNASAVAREIGGTNYKAVSRLAKKANITLSRTSMRAASSARRDAAKRQGQGLRSGNARP